MSATLSTTRQNVYYMTKDTDPASRVTPSQAMSRIIVNQAIFYGARLGPGLSWSTGLVTLTVGSLTDYTVTLATPATRIIAARIAETGETLEKVSFDEINAYREGLISTATQNDPTLFALWEIPTQVLRMRIDSVPRTARTIDFLVSSLPSRTAADTTTLPFSEMMLSAVEYASAAEAIVAMSPAQLERLQLNPAYADECRANARRASIEERERLDRLERSGYAVGVF